MKLFKDMFFFTVSKLPCLQLFLIVLAAKFFAWLETFSSKFNCGIIAIFGTVSPVFLQLAVTELLGSKVRSSFGAN